jgi:hypothetical protein
LTLAVTPARFKFTSMVASFLGSSMVASFGLNEGYQLPRFPLDRLVERVSRLDIWHLLKCGLSVQGAVLDVKMAGGSCLRLTRKPGILEIAAHPVSVVYDQPMPGVARPWFECPVCGHLCRHVYLRDTIACRRCHRLDWASRHLRRQTPGVGRIERLRRKLGVSDIRPFAPLPPLLRGRSRAFHDRLVAMILAEEAALLGILQTTTLALDRRIRIRKARGKW